MKPLVRLVAIVLMGYLGIICVLSFFENKLVFVPAVAPRDWAEPPTDEIQEVELKSADGNRIGAWWLPCPGSDATILYLHGNAGNLSHRGGSVVKLRRILNAAVLIIDYPGYGKSTGSPTEQGCYRAAEAGYDYLVNEQKRRPDSLLLYGASLGGAVAVDVGARRPHGALVLIKSFTSAPDVGASRFPWLPVHWVMRNRFASIDKIGSIHTPVFIAHGDIDSVIPFAHGEALFQAANEPKEFLRLEGQDHNDGMPEEFFDRLKAFLTKNAASVK
jgi:uncharacterized protein